MSSLVHPRTETALREAMARLLAGEPRRTDGRLTKANLAKEAGVSRATAHRAAAVLADFDRAIVQLRETPEQVPGFLARIRELEVQLARTTAEKERIIKDLRASVNLLAQRVQALTLAYQQLWTETEGQRGNVSRLPRP